MERLILDLETQLKVSIFCWVSYTAISKTFISLKNILKYFLVISMIENYVYVIHYLLDVIFKNIQISVRYSIIINNIFEFKNIGNSGGWVVI